MSSSSSTTSTTCYYRNGTVATNDVPCPGSEQCCPNGDTCMENGLCRDKNNHPNGTATTFSDGHTYNYTGLYYTPSCQNVTYNGCLIDCTTYSSGSGEYIWACTDALITFCCHLDSDGLGQRDCCTHGLFTLAAPSQTTSPTSTSASVPASTSPTSPATSTTFAATATSPAAQSTSSGATSSHNSNANSLSSGAKAGIGIGAAASIIIIVVLATLLYRSHRRTPSGSSGNPGKRGTYMRSELDSKNMPANYGRSGMTELEAPTRPTFYAAELPAR